jgi:hypothetical protein
MRRFDGLVLQWSGFMSSHTPPPVTTSAAPLPPPSFGDLARRMRRRTLDLIAIGVVLIAGGVVGRLLIEAYRRPIDGPPDPTANASPGFAEELPVDLDFGEAEFALARQIVEGTAEDAATKLAELLRSKIETALPPAEAPNETERQLIDAALKRPAFLEQSGEWSLHALDERFGMQVGLRNVAKAEGDTSRQNWRVTVWGLSLPTGENRWSLYAVTPGGRTQSPNADQASGPLPELPPGAMRTLRIEDARGEFVLGFSGKGPVEAWRTFFEERFAREGLVGTGWVLGPDRVSARFIARSDGPHPGATVSLELTRDPNGDWRGLLIGTLQ